MTTTITTNTKGPRSVLKRTTISTRTRSRSRVRGMKKLTINNNVNPQPSININRKIRRARRRANKIIKNMTTNVLSPNTKSYWYKYFGNGGEPLSVVSSVHKTVQTLFYPALGIHRGLAYGMESTGISYFQGSFDLTPATVATALAFNFCPSLTTQSNSTASFNFLTTNANTTLALALGNLRNVPTQTVGPFIANNNPSIKSRVVSATLNIIPGGQLLYRSGEGKIGYATYTNNSDADRMAIDNFSISTSWDGTEAMSLHWVPNGEEQQFSTGSYNPSDTFAPFSSFWGYCVFPATANPPTWRFEYQVGIEYVPERSYRPYIDRLPPDNAPDTYYHINHIVMKHWQPLMIDTFANYRARYGTASAHSLGGRLGIHMTGAGTSGIGFGNAQIADDTDLDDYDQLDDGYLSAASRTGSKIINAGCNSFKRIGLDVCGDPIGVAGNIAEKLMGIQTSIGRMDNRAIRN